MSDQSPKKLDKLFQQGSEQYDFDYNAEAWQQMETLLEKDDRRRRFFWWFAGLAMLVLVVTFLFLRNENAETSPSESIVQNSKQSISQKEPSENDLEDNQQPTLFENQNNTESNQNSNTEKTFSNSINEELIHQEEAKKIENSFSTESSIIAKKGKESSKILPITGTHFQKTKDEKLILKGKELPTKTIVQDSTIQELKKDKTTPKINLLPAIPPIPIALLGSDEKHVLSYNFPNETLAEEEIKTGEKQKKSKQFGKNAFFFGLLVGAEMTSVGMDNFSKLSWKLGAQFDYRFLDKYSVSLGANFMKKNYEAGEGEYIPPKGFWTRTIAPQSTLGTCKIVEVPLIFGYYPKGFSNNGFYFNAGLNSYFMLWEWYDYFYDVPDPDLVRGWGTEENSQYWFGIGQVSVGYNHLMGRKTSLQIEPYFQFPLTGVGHGNVKLWSVGVSLKANLRL